MGFQRDQGSCKRGRDRTLSLDESGQLSIDFMIGISIFLITLIIAATMISGLLVGLQSKTIDYDAVAYRTGVILVEDPGEPNTIFNYRTIEADDQWELIPIDRIDLISRFGLTLYKSTPRVLSQEKVDNFFELDRYSTSEISERLIFGSYPYRFNIEVKKIGGASYPQVGDQYSDDMAYGYIRRVVLIKEASLADIDMNTYLPDPDGKLKVELNYQEIMNIDGAPDYIAPQYWIEPPKEDITIELNPIGSIDNPAQPGTPILNSIRIEYEGHLSDGTVVTGELPLDVPAKIDGQEYTFKWLRDPGNDPHPVTTTVETTFAAGYFIPSSSFADVGFTKMYVIYEFDPATVITILNKNQNSYKYGSSPPTLQPAVLEVRVW